MDDISIEVKRQLIGDLMKQWKNTLYVAKVNASTGQALLDAHVDERGKGLIDQAQADIKQSTVAIEFLEKKLDELKE